MKPSPFSNDEYTIGWISALNEEFMIAMAMLDEEHGRPQSTPRDDTNAYHLGRIGEHNITMACLSGGQMGTGPAAIVAENMRRTFKNIRFALLVGIGGGAPNGKKDIRLGDIVVSYPNGIYTGVVQYDYGKLNGNGDIERKDWFCAPPPKILAAVDLLRAYHSRPKNPRNNIPGILNELGEQYAYPEEHVAPDLLFQAGCDHHPGAETCDFCDKEALVERKVRNSTSCPHVHYGIIASGSMVVKNGVERDKIDRRYANMIFCFDMEAAGLMNNFPCLVIRGISDYSDSHKNNQWRKHATAVASAYAKELLSLIEPSDVEVLRPIAAQVLNAVSQNIAKIDGNTAETTRLLKRAENEARKRDLSDLKIQCERWLNPPNVRQIQQEQVKARLPGTCDWIWSNTTFTNWKSLSAPPPLDGMLCICGPPGCGKSVLGAYIADHMRKDGAYALFFAFTGMYASHRKLDALVRSLLSQLLQIPPKEQAIRIVHNLMLKGQPTSSDLWTAFNMIADTFITKPIYCIVDGVDESIDIVHELVQKLLSFLQTHSNFRFIILGRSHVFHSLDSVRLKIEMDSTLTKQDADTVIEAEIAQSNVLNLPDLQTEICRTLTEQSEGNFLWIKLMFAHLNKSIGAADALERLHNLPQNLQRAYEDLLFGLVSRLEDSELNLAKKVFAFISVSQRPLSLEEFQYLFAADAMSAPPRKEHSIEDYLILRPDHKILDVCGGLVSILDDHLRLVHFSVMEFLTRPESQWSQSERSCEIQLFRVSVKQAHGWVAAASIEYLEMCYYSSQTHEWSKSPNLAKHNQLFGYSSRYSMIHIMQSDIKPGFIAAKIKKFLNSDLCVACIEYSIMIMIDNESLHSHIDQFKQFISWLDDEGHSQELSQRILICLSHEIERRSQQYGEIDSRTERIRLFLALIQDESTSTNSQAMEPSSVGSVGTPTDMSSILQILRHEAPLSLELKANLCLQIHLLRKTKQLTDPLQMMFRILLEKTSSMPTYALLDVGNFYFDVEQLKQALEIYFAGLNKIEKKEVPLKFIFLHNIGLTYRRLGQYDNALEYLTKALAGREKVLGPEHEDTLRTIDVIGFTYNCHRHYNEALEYLMKALAGQEKISKPKHKVILFTISNIGDAYNGLQQYDKALEYLTKALTGFEKLFGPEHENTLLTSSKIGDIYFSLKQNDKALDYLAKAFAGYEQIFGPEHKSTLNSIHNIGVTYDHLKQYDKALDYLAKALAGYERIFGPEHKNTLLAINNIRLIYDHLEHDNNVLDNSAETFEAQEKASESEQGNTQMIQKLLGFICCNFRQ